MLRSIHCLITDVRLPNGRWNGAMRSNSSMRSVPFGAPSEALKRVVLIHQPNPTRLPVKTVICNDAEVVSPSSFKS